MHSSSTFQSDTTQANKNTNHNNNNNNETTLTTIDNNDDIDITRLLNILNWSPLEELVTTTTAAVIPPSTNEDNETKSKNGYNAVQISIELQKKMLR